MDTAQQLLNQDSTNATNDIWGNRLSERRFLPAAYLSRAVHASVAFAIWIITSASVLPEDLRT
jgi:hypothetical protein